MTRAALAVPILVLGLLLGGAGLKAHRYGQAPAAGPVPIDAAVERLLASRGWLPDSSWIGPPAEILHARAFTKAGCRQPIVVAALPGSGELERFVGIVLGDDVAYLQNGNVEARPRALGAQLARLRSGTSAGDVTLAIAPAPGTGAMPCAGPTVADWQALRPASTQR